MSLLSDPSVKNDGVLLRQVFVDRRIVQDNSGVLVGCNVGLYGPGIKTTAVSSRVTYDRTQSWLINANKMTIRARIRTGAANNGATRHLIAKTNTGYNDNQFFFGLFTNYRPFMAIANAVADTSQYSITDASLALSTTYVLHAVYDGTLGVGSRVIQYVNGLAVAATITGMIPAAMRANTIPLTLFNLNGGNTLAPDTDFTLLDCGLWAKALSPADVLLDAFDGAYWSAP